MREDLICDGECEGIGQSVHFTAKGGKGAVLIDQHLPEGATHERCGNLDPGVVLYLMEEKSMTAQAIGDLLYHSSGLRGVSGISNDMRPCSRAALSAKALRDGQPADVPAAEIVPGDIVLLAASDLVPADSRLIEARDLYVDEALLTGEAYPAEKEVAPATADAAHETALPTNLVFMGSSVVTQNSRHSRNS
jgi:hypothetical protein